MGRTPIPAPPREELHERYIINGEYVKDLATRYGASRPTVERWLSEYGLRRNTEAKVWPMVTCPHCGSVFQSSKDRKVYCNVEHARADKAAQMNEARRIAPPPRDQLEGKFVKDICLTYNVGTTTAQGWLALYGLSAPRRALDIPPRDQLEGKPQKQLEADLGVSRPTILKWQKHYGIVPPPKPKRVPKPPKPKRMPKPRPKRPKAARLPPVEKARYTKCIIPERPAPRDDSDKLREQRLIEEFLCRTRSDKPQT